MQPNPFRGLAPYTESDKLFERDGDVDLIKSRLWSSRYTVLFAGSGVGKTSFLRAKLIGSLKQSGEDLDVEMLESWTVTNPVLELQNFRERLKHPNRAESCVLILDQFEEVFQTFPNVVLFNALGRELSKFANVSSRVDVRILMSVREEFLAELSGFEDFMPGLFTNYYRLERPTVQQAGSIILNTVNDAGTETAKTIDILLDDLRLIRSQQSVNSNVVDPPYLQIVCHRVWNREQPRDGAQFLHTYVRGQAALELEQYIREKLKERRWRDKVLLSKVVTHLAGPHEAKKYMPLRDLAHHVGERNLDKLRKALDPLCSEEVRILKGKNDVYGLYHDMYAPMLWDWRDQQIKLQQRIRIGKWVVMSIAVIFFIVYPLAMWWRVQTRLEKPEYGNLDEYVQVLTMRNDLSQTVLWRFAADHLWLNYNRKLAALAALKMDSDGEVLYKLASLSVVGPPATPASARNFIKPELNLLATLKSQTSDGIADATLVGELSKPQYLVEGTALGRFIRVPLNSDPKAELQPVSVDLDESGDKNSTISSPQIKLLTLVPNVDEALVAWVTPLAPNDQAVKSINDSAAKLFPIHFASFSTFTGERTGRYEFDLSRAEFSQQRDLPPPDITGIPIPVDVLTTLQQLRASFSPTKKVVAVVANGIPFVFDTTSRRKRRVKISHVSKLEFMAENLLIASQSPIQTASGNRMVETGEPEAVSFCKVPQMPLDTSITCTATDFYLRPEARFVFRTDGRALLQNKTDARAQLQNKTYGRALLQKELRWEWVWAGADRSLEQFGRPTTISGFAPQAFDERNDGGGLLLVKDSDQRLFLVPTGPGAGDPFLLVSTEPRLETDSSTFAPALRTLTAASLLSFHDGRLISLDKNGKLVRLWEVPSGPLPQQISAPVELTYQPTVPSVWKAVISGTKLTVYNVEQNKEMWSVDHLPSDQVRFFLMSAKGGRVLIFYENEIAYALVDGKAAKAYCYKSGASAQYQGQFGPGDDRVTLLTPELVAIHKPSTWPICADPGEARDPEWTAPVGIKTRFLEPTADETGVVLFSGRWVHRLTLGRNHWPNIISVFSDVQLNSANLESQKLDDSSTVRIHGTGLTIGLKDEEFSSNTTAEGGLRALWSSPFELRLCNSSKAKGRSFGLTDEEVVSFTGDQDSSGSWRNLMCQIENRTDRRAGASR